MHSSASSKNFVHSRTYVPSKVTTTRATRPLRLLHVSLHHGDLYNCTAPVPIKSFKVQSARLSYVYKALLFVAQHNACPVLPFLLTPSLIPRQRRASTGPGDFRELEGLRDDVGDNNISGLIPGAVGVDSDRQNV